MARVTEVANAADPRLHEYVGLTEVERRLSRESAEGFFLAESELVIRRVVRAGYALRSVLVSAGRRDALADLLEQLDVPVYVAAPDVLEQVTGFHVHRGALASVDRRPLPTVEEILAGAHRLLVCEAITNHTNLGAMFRSAAALGMDAVLLDPTCVDPLYRRCVRVSMGEVFAVPYTRLSPWPDGLQLLRAAGFEVIALTPDPAAEPLDRLDVAALDRAAVLLGSEGPGLTAGALAAAGRAARIPMAGGVDSLNVAAATAVACYVLGRR